MLKTSLAKTVREGATLNTGSLEIPSNTDLLKKHIAMVFDRLGKGARLISTGPVQTSGSLDSISGAQSPTATSSPTTSSFRK